MRAIEDIQSGSLDLAALESEKLLRDADITRLRAEQQTIHDLQEPLWHREHASAAGPSSLAQKIVTSPANFKDQLSGLSLETLTTMFTDLFGHLKGRGGNDGK